MKNLEILSKAGLKVTKTRKHILDIFMNTNDVLEASEVYCLCIDKKIEINLSTIYRICEAFSSKNILQKVVKSNRVVAYKYLKNSHFHELSCDICNKTIEINCPFNILRHYIEIDTGFVLTNHDIEIAGICNECKNKN